VELVLALPARAADPAHRPDQDRTDRRGRPDGDEQAVHRSSVRPVSLESNPKCHDIPLNRAFRRGWRKFHMANWSDPRIGASQPTTTVGRDVAYDAGLRAHVLSVYNYMSSGVLLSGIVAMLFARSGMAFDIMVNGGLLRWLIIL